MINNKINLFLLISIGLNILLLSLNLFLAKTYGLLSPIKSYLPDIFKKIDSGYSVYYVHKKSQFELLVKSENTVIFLGDSITDEGEWTELLGKSYAKNRGISGDTTVGILNRLPEIIESKPRQIFMMIGINDLNNQGKSINQTLTDYQNILIELKNQTPNTEVFIQSVLPVNNKISRYWQNNHNIIKFNLALKELAQQYKYQYIDIFSHLADSEHQLEDQYTLDGLHLNGQGYLVWKKVIEKYVE
ncbi:GDSL-type esterase/lipase family protein [Fortiea contorta]|uniref:GDSL-type esterase/lipase family protein n=1 Tax=Fortiea contorta TaxID=1892405 RepID=UPI00034CB03A|nr:GDSL-type esterase/lipase family protein [Fortiea contorta]